MAKVTPISLDKVKSYPLKERTSKVSIEQFGNVWQEGGTLVEWLKSLPKILAGSDFNEIVDRIVRAAANERTIVLAMGTKTVDHLKKELEEKVPEFYVIGDALEPRQAIEAIEEGARVALKI